MAHITVIANNSQPVRPSDRQKVATWVQMPTSIVNIKQHAAAAAAAQQQVAVTGPSPYPSPTTLAHTPQMVLQPATSTPHTGRVITPRTQPNGRLARPKRVGNVLRMLQDWRSTRPSHWDTETRRRHFLSDVFLNFASGNLCGDRSSGQMMHACPRAARHTGIQVEVGRSR